MSVNSFSNPSVYVYVENRTVELWTKGYSPIKKNKKNNNKTKPTTPEVTALRFFLWEVLFNIHSSITGRSQSLSIMTKNRSQEFYWNQGLHYRVGGTKEWATAKQLQAERTSDGEDWRFDSRPCWQHGSCSYDYSVWTVWRLVVPVRRGSGHQCVNGLMVTWSVKVLRVGGPQWRCTSTVPLPFKWCKDEGNVYFTMISRRLGEKEFTRRGSVLLCRTQNWINIS